MNMRNSYQIYYLEGGGIMAIYYVAAFLKGCLIGNGHSLVFINFRETS